MNSHSSKYIHITPLLWVRERETEPRENETHAADGTKIAFALTFFCCWIFCCIYHTHSCIHYQWRVLLVHRPTTMTWPRAWNICAKYHFQKILIKVFTKLQTNVTTNERTNEEKIQQNETYREREKSDKKRPKLWMNIKKGGTNEITISWS